MQIYFADEESIGEELIASMTKAAELCAEDFGLDPDIVSLCVSFVGKDEIKELNGGYRGVDRVTDVLSFPMYEAEEIAQIARDGADVPELELGDVVICMDKVLEQAEEFGHSEARESVYLFTHSVLHLLGFDHETPEEKELMREREESVMRRLSLERRSDD